MAAVLEALGAETQLVVEMVQFAWEIANLCTFICEESIQCATMGMASALNKGDAYLAKKIMEKGFDEALNTYTTYLLISAMFLLPSTIGFTHYAMAALEMKGETDFIVNQIEAMPGKRRYPGLTRYGRFF